MTTLAALPGSLSDLTWGDEIGVLGWTWACMTPPCLHDATHSLVIWCVTRSEGGHEVAWPVFLPSCKLGVVFKAGH